MLTIKLGVAISFLSLGCGLYYIFLYLSGRIKVLGFTSIILSISFFSGVIIMILGMLGLYLGQVFDQVKNRPLYVIQNKIN